MDRVILARFALCFKVGSLHTHVKALAVTLLALRMGETYEKRIKINEIIFIRIKLQKIS